MSSPKLHVPISLWLSVSVVLAVVAVIAVTKPSQLIPGVSLMVGLLLVCYLPNLLKAAVGYEKRRSICEKIQELGRMNEQV